MKKRIISALIAGVLVMSLAACSKGSDSSAASGTAAEGVSTITIETNSDLSNLAPSSVQNDAHFRCGNLYYEKLLDYDKDGNIIPCLATSYLRYMNVRTIAEARRLDSDIILNGFTGMNRIPLFADEEIGVDGVHYFRFTPSLGGDVLPEDPISVFLKGGHPDIDYLVGEAAGEGVRTVVADVAWCRNQNALGRRPTYQYFFRRVPPGASGAFHSCEQEYMFQTLLKSLEWHYTGTDFDISNDMADYFCNFIKTGDPNGPGLAAWTPHTADSPRAMQFDEERKMIDVPLTDAMETTIGKLMRNEILFGLNDKS